MLLIYYPSQTLPIDDLILPKINGGEWRPLPKFPSSPIPHYIHKIDQVYAIALAFISLLLTIPFSSYLSLLSIEQFDFLHGIIVFDQVLKSKIVDTTSLLDFAGKIYSIGCLFAPLTPTQRRNLFGCISLSYGSQSILKAHIMLCWNLQNQTFIC